MKKTLIVLACVMLAGVSVSAGKAKDPTLGSVDITVDASLVDFMAMGKEVLEVREGTTNLTVTLTKIGGKSNKVTVGWIDENIDGTGARVKATDATILGFKGKQLFLEVTLPDTTTKIISLKLALKDAAKTKQGTKTQAKAEGSFASAYPTPSKVRTKEAFW